MSVIIFLIILSLLVLVHEFGHFFVAKFFGIRVDEFGLGYPPLVKKLFRWRGTDFTLNGLPFGGFVKIFGENPIESHPRKDLGETLGLSSGEDKIPRDSFQHKNRGVQALVLVAGVVCNFLFAWVLMSFGFMIGMPAPLGLDLPVTNPQTIITTVLSGSPAEALGIKSGDTILTINNIHYSPESARDLIANTEGSLEFKIKRGEKVYEKTVVPQVGVVEGKRAVGIAMEMIGTVKLGFFKSIAEGWKTTIQITKLTAFALWDFMLQAARGRADFSTVTGPVGLVGMVGDMEELGFSYLITFTALISINLCLINLLPFPALDGGRLLFVGLEAITRRSIPPKIFNTANAAGFALLIFLMILVTIRDVRNIL